MEYCLNDFLYFKNFFQILLSIGRPPSLNELTPMVFNTGLTHLSSQASIGTVCFSNDFIWVFILFFIELNYISLMAMFLESVVQVFSID